MSSMDKQQCFRQLMVTCFMGEKNIKKSLFPSKFQQQWPEMVGTTSLIDCTIMMILKLNKIRTAGNNKYLHVANFFSIPPWTTSIIKEILSRKSNTI